MQKHYIAVKMVEAVPMTMGEYHIYLDWEMPIGVDPATEGYIVTHSDGSENWIIKEDFDSAYLELVNPTSISKEDIDLFIGPDAFSAMQLDEKTTMVRMIPRTGFVQYETSSCVNPENYDHEMGVQICADRLRNKLWPMMGFLLQWAKNGLKPLPAKEETPDADSAGLIQ